MIQLIIADDHRVLVEGLQLLLGRQPDFRVIATANDGRQLLSLLREHTPDLVLLDVEMPLVDGLTACKEIRREYPTVKILALSSFRQGALIQRMLANGADGYVLKNKVSEELVTAIRTVMAGGLYVDAEANQHLLQTLANRRERSAYLPDLTPRELDVLKLIVAEHNTREIGQFLHISEHTVETHRRHMLEKLGVKNVAGLVRVTLERGLLE